MKRIHEVDLLLYLDSLMHVLFKFPTLINHSDYLPHLVEHCVAYSIQCNKRHGFNFVLSLQCYSNCYAIWIDFWIQDNLKRIKSIIKSIKLIPELISLEKKSIREEYDWYSRDMYIRMTQKVGHIIFWNTFRYYYTATIPNSTVIKYFNEYITLENCVILDSRHNIKYIWEKVMSSGQSLLKTTDNSTWRHNTIRLREGKHLIWRKKIQSVSDVRLTDFVEFMLNSYSFLCYRIDKGEYFNIKWYNHHFPKHTFVGWRDYLVRDAIKDFTRGRKAFEKLKKGFIYNMEYWSYKFWLADFLVLYGIPPDFEQVKKIIEDIEIEHIAKIFGLESA